MTTFADLSPEGAATAADAREAQLREAVESERALRRIHDACRESAEREYDELRTALKRLTKHAVYNDNGRCSVCHGYWPGEHADDCPGAYALAVLHPNVAPASAVEAAPEGPHEH